jgi:hypothetical protein
MPDICVGVHVHAEPDRLRDARQPQGQYRMAVRSGAATRRARCQDGGGAAGTRPPGPVERGGRARTARLLQPPGRLDRRQRLGAAGEWGAGGAGLARPGHRRALGPRNGLAGPSPTGRGTVRASSRMPAPDPPRSPPRHERRCAGSDWRRDHSGRSMISRTSASSSIGVSLTPSAPPTRGTSSGPSGRWTTAPVPPGLAPRPSGRSAHMCPGRRSPPGVPTPRPGCSRRAGGATRTPCAACACAPSAPTTILTAAVRLASTSLRRPHCRAAASPGVAPTQDLTPSALPAVDAWSEDGPLVSCILPTGGRPDLVLQSVRYFQRQDYRRRELVIVDDGLDGLAALLPDDERVRYFRCPPGLSIGTKRNRACELARGEIIAH